MFRDDGEALWVTLLDERVSNEAVEGAVARVRNVHFVADSRQLTGKFEPPHNFPVAPPLPLLFAAVTRGSAGLVRSLLERRARVDDADSAQNTPLILAAALSNAAVVEALCSARADVRAHNCLGKTALLLATERIDTTSSPEVVEVLVARRADPFARDALGRCAFDVSREFAHGGLRAYAYTLFLCARPGHAL